MRYQAAVYPQPVLLTMGVTDATWLAAQIDEDEPCPLECVRQVYKGACILHAKSHQAPLYCFTLCNACPSAPPP